LLLPLQLLHAFLNYSATKFIVFQAGKEIKKKRRRQQKEYFALFMLQT